MKFQEDNYNKFRITYDVIIALLSFIVVAILIFESTMYLSTKELILIQIIDSLIWIIFCGDYFIRLFLSKNKIYFIKSNVIDLISIIPFNSIFKALRILKIIKLVKLSKILKLTKFFRTITLMAKFKKRLNKFIKTNNFNYVLYLTIATVFLGAIGIIITEKMELIDALWWSFVTTTTVGYGDISPSTLGGRAIAIILMLVGIGFIGMLTGTIATFFIDGNKEKTTYKQSVIDDVKNKLDDFESLSKEDLKDMFNILDKLKE